MSAAPFATWEAALNFVRAGRARVTLRSGKTGRRYTYRVRAGKGTDARSRYYVDVLTGPDNGRDYTYLGMICQDRFFVTAATRHMEQAAHTKAFKYAYEHLSRRHHLPPQVEIWHESACGRCGRPLTVPASIASGIGPECSKRG